jgi:hypothetical protein
MKWVLQIAILLWSVAYALPTRAQAPFSCSPSFEARQQRGGLDPELSTWIVQTARRFAKEHASTVWQKHSDFLCVDLNCISDEEIVARVGKRCAAEPRQTLEQAAKHVGFLEELHEACEHGYIKVKPLSGSSSANSPAC